MTSTIDMVDPLWAAGLLEDTHSFNNDNESKESDRFPFSGDENQFHAMAMAIHYFLLTRLVWLDVAVLELAKWRRLVWWFVGVHFETTDNQLTKSISTALRVLVQGVEAFHRESNASTLLSPRVSCEDSASTSSRWAQGEQLFKWVHFIYLAFLSRLFIV